MKKLATYRIDKTIVNREYERITNKTHAQIDYILTERRWRNPITNVESDTRANIYSDHSPLTLTTNIKLKAIPKGGKSRPMYKPCNPTQNNDLNYELWNTIPSVQNLTTAEEHQQNKYNTIKNWLKQGIDTLPKSKPKDKNKRSELSEKSHEILDKRKQAARDRNPQLFLQLNKELIKIRKEDKNKQNTGINV